MKDGGPRCERCERLAQSIYVESHIGNNTPVTVWYEYSPGQPGQSAGPSDIHQRKEDEQVVITKVSITSPDPSSFDDYWDNILPDLSPECIDRLEQQCWDEVR